MKKNSSIVLTCLMLFGLGAKANNIETAAKAFERLVAENKKSDTFCIKLNEKRNVMGVFIEGENKAVVFDLDGQKKVHTCESTKDEGKVKDIDFDGCKVVVKRAGLFRDSKETCCVGELREEAANDANTKCIELDGLEDKTAIEKALKVALTENQNCKNFRVKFDSKKRFVGVILLDANIVISFDLQSENPELRVFDLNPSTKVNDLYFEVNKGKDGKDSNQIILCFLGKTSKHDLKTGECVYSRTLGYIPASKLYF